MLHRPHQKARRPSPASMETDRVHTDWSPSLRERGCVSACAYPAARAQSICCVLLGHRGRSMSWCSANVDPFVTFLFATNVPDDLSHLLLHVRTSRYVLRECFRVTRLRAVLTMPPHGLTCPCNRKSSFSRVPAANLGIIIGVRRRSRPTMRRLAVADRMRAEAGFLFNINFRLIRLRSLTAAASNL